jgi:branched-chain amino acid transport system ATP-binding protein
MTDATLTDTPPAAPQPPAAPRLQATGLTGGRGNTTAFRDVDLSLAAGTVLALLGPNGAGKTTALLTLSGLLPARGGTLHVDGTPLRCGKALAANRAGIVLVPDTRSLFTTLTVEENLRVAATRGGPKPREMIDVFPALEKRWHVASASLSGGEQQMLALARALVQRPKVLLVDELSMGLAPLIVSALFDTVRSIATDHGCAVILVEQHVNLALQAADEAAVLNRGTIVLRGAASELAGDPDRLEQAYFGTA